MNKILLAFCLGDGYLSPRGFFHIHHKPFQKEYIEYKAKFFNKEITLKSVDNINYYYFYKGTFNNKMKGQEVRKKLYGVLKHKYFSKDIVNEMDLFCFAILYLDKGSLCEKRRNGKIHAYDLVISLAAREEECLRLIKKLQEDYDLHFTLKYNRGRYSIRCGTKEAKKFLKLIKTVIPDFYCFKNTKMKLI